jgi:hypothetical protein
MSKFLRQMAALSKKPSDFQRPAAAMPGPEPPKATTVDKLATVDKVPTVAKVSTVGKLAVTLDGEAVEPARCKPATLVQHGHTSGEHAVYTALWNLGGPPDRKDEYRDVSVGYDKLAAQVSASKRNMQRILDTLRQKLAIEMIRPEVSGLRQGKTYRVYGMGEILRRRREAGYTWAFRNRSGVDLVKMSTVDKLATVGTLPTVASQATVGSLSTETVDTLSTGAVDSLSTPLGTFLGRTEEASSSALVEAAARHGLVLDDDAANKIVRRCRSGDEAASLEEIAYFTEAKINQLRRRRNIENWVGLLLQAVPAYFTGEAVELRRYRAERAGQDAAQRRTAEAVLNDPGSSEQDRELALDLLRGAS